MTEKELMTLIESRLSERLALYIQSADSGDHHNQAYNTGRIQATKAILWEMEDIKDLYEI